MSRGRKQLAALAAPAFIVLMGAATPSVAFDGISQQQSPGVMFYFSVPLDGKKAKDFIPDAGLAIQGKREHETVRIDSRMFNSQLFNFAGTGIEAKWVIAGVVAAGAVVAVAAKGKSTTEGHAQAQEQQAAAQQQAAQQQAVQQQQAQQQAAQQQQAQQQAGGSGGGGGGGGTPVPCPEICAPRR